MLSLVFTFFVTNEDSQYLGTIISKHCSDIIVTLCATISWGHSMLIFPMVAFLYVPIFQYNKGIHKWRTHSCTLMVCKVRHVACTVRSQVFRLQLLQPILKCILSIRSHCHQTRYMYFPHFKILNSTPASKLCANVCYVLSHQTDSKVY